MMVIALLASKLAVAVGALYPRFFCTAWRLTTALRTLARAAQVVAFVITTNVAISAEICFVIETFYAS